MKLALLVFAVAVIPSGCALMPHSSYPDPQALQNSVSSYWVGQPISAVQARYGLPSDCVSPSPLGNARGCYWREHATRGYNHPTTQTVTGQVGDASQYPYNQPVPYSATVSGSRTEYESYDCTLQIEVNQQGVIVAAGLAGKMGACAYFEP
jgi:hypothetical protein